MPVGLRAEPVPARDHSLLGFIFIFDDLRPAPGTLMADDAERR